MTDIVFVLRCDGRRDFIEQSIESAEDNLKGEFSRLFIIDDSGDQDYAGWLEHKFPLYEIIHHATRRGMNECVKSAFQACMSSGAEFAWSTEDDFTYTRTIPVRKMARLLHCEQYLGSLTLKRQPWSSEEIAAGGQMEMSPDSYKDMSCPIGNWVEHQGLWSGNPSLTRVSAMRAALDKWDTVVESDTYEKPCGDAMRAAGYLPAFYGKRSDDPRCFHLGATRSNGYRW